MKLYEDPAPLDIFVSLVIGLLVGALVTSIIFMTVIKKKWEARWDYFNRIKSISQLRLPDIAVDNTPLSRNSIQDTVVTTSALSDKGFVQTFWNQTDGAEMSRQVSNESYFLNATPSANHYSNSSFGGYQKTSSSPTSPKNNNMFPRAHQHSRWSNNFAGSLDRPGSFNHLNLDTMPHQSDSKSDDDENGAPEYLFLDLLNMILKRQMTTDQISLLVAVSIGIIIGIFITIAALYMWRCLKPRANKTRLKTTKNRSNTLQRLGIRSRSSLVLPQITSTSLAETFDLEKLQSQDLNNAPAESVVNLTIEDAHLNLFSLSEQEQKKLDASVHSLPKTTIHATDCALNQEKSLQSRALNESNDLNDLNHRKVVTEGHADQRTSPVLDNIVQSPTSNINDSGVNIPDPIVTSKPPSLKSIDSSQSFRSDITDEDSPLGMILKSECGDAS